MALKREYTMTVNKTSSVLNKNLTISTNDKGIDIIFRLIDCPYINLSMRKNLYARVILLDPLGKQIDSDITSIVENRVLFRLTSNLMSNITETGIYKLYIAIYDEKNNVDLLPPIKCVIEPSEVEVKGLSVGLINKSGIDNALSTDYGNEITLFNADGSYNRTVWVSGDMITTARMNKIEDGISNARDNILAIKDEIADIKKPDISKRLTGTKEIPICIADLKKGFYIIDGYVTDFRDNNSYTLFGENYFMVTYCGDTYSRIERCLDTEKTFLKFKYDKNLETIYRKNDDLVECKQEQGYLVISEDKYQYVDLAIDTTTESPEIKTLLPDIDEFAEINLYVKVHGKCTLKMNEIKIDLVANPEHGNLNLLTLNYINGNWYVK